MGTNIIRVTGNYLTIQSGGNTYEFQLKNVFFRTENDTFIIRDVTYRFIIAFAEVENYGDGRTRFTIESLNAFLLENTGSLGLPFQSNDLTISPRA
jgi:hypothetical protein